MRMRSRKTTPKVKKGKVQRKNRSVLTPNYYDTPMPHLVIDRKRPGQRNTLLLTARQFPRKTVLVAFHPHQPQHLADARGLLVLRTVTYIQPVADVALNAEVRPQRVVLEYHPRVALVRGDSVDVSVVEVNRTGVGLKEPGDQSKERCLAAARRSQQEEELTASDSQRDIVDGGDLAEGPGQVLKANLDQREMLP